MGAGIGGPDHAQAGVQRLDPARHHEGWQTPLIGEVLWERADQHLSEMRSQQGRVVLSHESRVLEQAESEPIVDPSAVRSSRARRLGRTRTHRFTQVPVPIRVAWTGAGTHADGRTGWHPGAGRNVVVAEAERRRWTAMSTSGGHSHPSQHTQGKQVIHVFARGEGSGQWLRGWGRRKARCVVREKTGTTWSDEAGHERNTWEIARGKRVWGERNLLWDPHAHPFGHTGVLALPVHHADSPATLLLVVVRQGAGFAPCSLLTTEPVNATEHAWEIVSASATRWNIEAHVRCDRHELRIETFRVQEEEAQRTQLLLVTPAASCVLASLAPAFSSARTRLPRR